MGRTIDPIVSSQRRGAVRRPLLRPSVSMSLRLVIPWRVALQQSSPPLHQPTKILNQKCYCEKTNLFNGSVAKSNCLNEGVHPNIVWPICGQNSQHSTVKRWQRMGKNYKTLDFPRWLQLSKGQILNELPVV